MRYNDPFNAYMKYLKSYYRWMWRRKFRLIFGTMMFFIFLGLTLRFAGLSIYEDYGVTQLKDKTSGPIWDRVWQFRGQPPGWEDEADGIFPVGKAFEPQGLNGPLNWFFLPLEAPLVDLMIYIPAFMSGEIDAALNLDVLIGELGRLFLITGPIAAGGLGIALIIGIPAVIGTVFIIGLLSPLIIREILKRLTATGSILSRVLVVMLIILVVIMVAGWFISPDFYNEILEKLFGTIIHGG